MSMVNDENREVRLALVEIFGERQAVDALISFLNDEDLRVRFHTITSLGKTEDKKAIPPLINILEGKEELLRIAASKELGNIGDEKALHVLSKLSKQEKVDPSIREVAKEATEKIKERISTGR